MKNSFPRILFVAFAISFSPFLSAQNNPDDYWLNNGFTSGQTVITNSGFFYDDGGFDKYQTGQNWNVQFCSENGNPITIDFSGFKTDYRGPWPPGAGDYLAYDYLSINTFIPPVLIAYNDDTPQFSFTAPGGCVQFGFISQLTSISDSGWVAEISANPSPINNDPCDAIEVEVGTSCSPGFYTNKGAYNTTGLGSPSCHAYYGGDVWFRATVPESGELKIETLPGSLKYAIMTLYTGSCGSLSELSCVDNLLTMPTTIISGRTPGEIIYIRIFGDQAKSGTFGICSVDPAADVTGFRGPGGVGDETNNKVWYRADMGLLNASGNPVSHGNAVRTWLDQSGNSNDLVQGTSGFRPLLNSTAINSMPAVSFDGSDDQFSFELGSTSAPLSIFTTVSFSGSNDETLLAIGNANEDNTLSIGRENDTRYYSYSFSAKNYGPNIAASPVILNPDHKITSPYHNLLLNGSPQALTDYTSAITTDGSMIIGSSKDNDRYFSGDLAEVIIYDKSLNSAENIIVNNYLAAKYGINI